MNAYKSGSKWSLCSLIVICAAMMCAGPALATNELVFSDIEYWIGAGPNQAAVVIDWNDGPEPQSLVWGFRWQGTATGWDMLLAVVQADERLVLFPIGADGVFGLGYDLDGDGGTFNPGTPGHATETGYADDPDDHYQEGWYTGFWCYWACDTLGNAFPGEDDWEFSFWSAGERVLADGSWDGWSFDAAFGFDVTPSPPVPAPAPLQLGDLNCDGLVNSFDIDPFVLALTLPEVYEFAHPDCDFMLADINQDGVVNVFDIDPFVALLTS